MSNTRRTNFWYPVPLLDRLGRAKEQLGLTMSEIIRRAIEEYLNKHEIK